MPVWPIRNEMQKLDIYFFDRSNHGGHGGFSVKAARRGAAEWIFLKYLTVKPQQSINWLIFG